MEFFQLDFEIKKYYVVFYNFLYFNYNSKVYHIENFNAHIMYYKYSFVITIYILYIIIYIATYCSFW